MKDLKIYVSTYAKYNNGSIKGKWLNLLDYENLDELKKAMQNIHNDELDPEYMIQDFECDEIFKNLNLISESFISDDIYNIIEALNNACYDFEVYNSYITSFGICSNEIYEIIDQVEESYCGEFLNDIDFVENLLKDTGCIPDNLPSYIHIDWESTARDIMMDYSTDNNQYFRNI
ncbi:Antirestriction protein [Flaviramulus basaltis]|uniref:Antirestriction protein n=1 Tax=Flaviramulus basaltis TaxID=369401 RepID=A0A1K2IQ26_9FLAO|nr:antirestriction protein ArdA [Flaviramulus basaltis]SFZ94414.1 Antirestriction protein [Flaviramulus basaltis]